MEIREQHNLIRLLIESFALLNRCGGALVGYLITILLFMAAEIALVWVGVPVFLLKLANVFFAAYFSVVLFRIFGAKTEKTDESVSNALSASVFPAVYLLIFNILYGIIWVIFCFAAAFFLRTSSSVAGWILQIVTHTATSSTYIAAALTALAVAAVPLYIGARLLYAPAAIALRDQGPFEAIRYSFQLTEGTRVLTAAGAVLVIFFLPILFVTAALYGGYVAIPLYFADSFNLAQLSPAWIGAFVAVGLIYLAIVLAMPAFLVLVFLNQDYGFNRDSFTPQAQLQVNNRETQVFGSDGRALPPGTPGTVGVEVVQASVSATAADGVTQQHLQQVYQPKPEDLVQYADEEDRMPTILFDDDMARQIEQERALWENKLKQDKIQRGEDDAPSVKMSK